MSVAVASRSILLCTDASSGPDIRAALQPAGLDIAAKSIHDAMSVNGSPVQLILIDGGVQTEIALSLCRQLRSHSDDAYVPILFLASNRHGARQAGFEAGADAVLPRPFDAAELVAQARSLLRIKERHDQLAVKAAETLHVNQRLQAAYHLIDQELELAKRVQESFLPQILPQTPQVRFAAKYRPCGRVGGDFYDVFRLDEQHVGLYVADAMGHGVPASLLTVFVKASVQSKEISGQSYRLVPPDEVLARLNRAMIGQALTETPFITMAYALLHRETGQFRFSRAGHPYPLYVPRDGTPCLWQMEGSLLGVFDTHYQLQTRQLRPGDKVLLYTDGMDGASFGAHPVGQPSLLAAAEEFRRMPIDEMVDRLSSDLFSRTRRSDDLTVVGLEMQ